MSTSPQPLFDMSKAQPIQAPSGGAPLFDMSKAQPITGGQSQTQPQWPITPIEGEDFADTMKRAVEAGKTVTPEQLRTSQSEAIKKVPTVLAAAALAGPALVGGMAIAPEVASGLVGGGVLGSAAAGATGGLASEAIGKGLHAAAGENILTGQTAKDLSMATLTGALAGGGMGLFGKVTNSLFTSKLARGAINESLGATARDVTYGNPAKAILDERITTPFTGDIEKYKDALRAGAPPQQALISSGGRTAAVAQKVSELAPQVDQVLAKSVVPIHVSDVIDKPLMHAATGIINDPAMTAAEKDAALTQLGALQQSLKEGLSADITPLQANHIKQAIGHRINWGGNIAVTDEVKPAYRAVFGSLKNAVNKAVPEIADTNERLTNLLSAQTDLEKLMKAEEVGMGKGALGSAVTGIARRAEAISGRAIPALRAAGRTTPFAQGAVGAGAAQLLSQPMRSLADLGGGSGNTQ